MLPQGKKNEGRQAVRQQLKRRLAQAAFFSILPLLNHIPQPHPCPLHPAYCILPRGIDIDRTSRTHAHREGCNKKCKQRQSQQSLPARMCEVRGDSTKKRRQSVQESIAQQSPGSPIPNPQSLLPIGSSIPPTTSNCVQPMAFEVAHWRLRVCERAENHWTRQPLMFTI